MYIALEKLERKWIFFVDAEWSSCKGQPLGCEVHSHCRLLTRFKSFTEKRQVLRSDKDVERLDDKKEGCLAINNTLKLHYNELLLMFVQRKVVSHGHSFYTRKIANAVAET